MRIQKARIFSLAVAEGAETQNRRTDIFLFVFKLLRNRSPGLLKPWTYLKYNAISLTTANDSQVIP